MSGAVDPVTPDPVVTRKSWKPTNKWILATLVGVVGLVVAFVSEGSIDFTNGLEADEWLVLTLFVQRVVAYLASNLNTPGGVPTESVH
jgi:hypothetical protein